MSTLNPTYDDLSPARIRLAALMRDLGFGSITDLRVVAGEPVFEPAPRMLRMLLLGAPLRAPHRSGPGVRLKPQLVALFETLDAVQDGVIESIKIQDGLPVQVQHALEGVPAA